MSLFLLLSTTCKKDNDHPSIPYVQVNLNIDVYSTMFMNLSIVGGHEYIIGGYKGIAVYRLTQDDFVAYDRACSYDPNNYCRLNFNNTDIELVDSCCTSKFRILDGSPISGPAKTVLKQYQTSFDGQILRIFN
jgi:nitrite reductase/ring-hydroxylating ferredoxin subunit